MIFDMYVGQSGQAKAKERKTFIRKQESWIYCSKVLFYGSNIADAQFGNDGSQLKILSMS